MNFTTLLAFSLPGGGGGETTEPADDPLTIKTNKQREREIEGETNALIVIACVEKVRVQDCLSDVMLQVDIH